MKSVPCCGAPVLMQLLPRGSAVTPPPDTHLLSTCGPSRYGEGLPASPQLFQPLLRPWSTPDLPQPAPSLGWAGISQGYQGRWGFWQGHLWKGYQRESDQENQDSSVYTLSVYPAQAKKQILSNYCVRNSVTGPEGHAQMSRR